MKESGIAVPAKPNHFWIVTMTPSLKQCTRLCGCGCNHPLPYRPWRVNRFLPGHNNGPYIVPFVIQERGYDTPCWIWQRSFSSGGYGRINDKTAHVVFYELIFGEVPDGLQLDHLCRVRSCVNPNHLEPVTNRENTIRGMAAQVNRERMLARTHCKNGHEYTAYNTLIHKGKRECKTCIRESQKRSREKKRMAIMARRVGEGRG